MSQTKIVVLHVKEIIYTAIFIGLGILLILLLVFMFFPKNTATSNDAPTYNPGVYTSQMTMNNATLNLEVVVDKDHVNSIRFVNLDESITTMYPLLQPTLDKIAKQLYSDVPIKDIEITEDSKYTSVMILEAVESTLNKAVSK